MTKTTKKLKNSTPKSVSAKPANGTASVVSDPVKKETVVAKPAAVAAAPAPLKTAPVPVRSEPVITKAPTSAPQPAKVVAPVAQPARVVEAPKPVKRPHVSIEFVKPEAKHVCVAGSFNGWQPEETPLSPAGNGRWVGDLTMKPGRYEYLFVVDGQWLPDPKAVESVQNPFGGRNSVLIVSE